MNLFKDLVKTLDNEYASIADEGIVGDTIDWIDTGCYALNALLSGSIYGGFASNKVLALAGESSTGKTFYALSICKNFLDQNPEAGVFYFESEGALTKTMLAERGIDLSRFVVVPVATIQQFRTQALKVLEGLAKNKQRPKVLMCLDSLGMLSTTKELEDSSEGKETRDMTRAQVIRATFRVLSLQLAKLNIPMIFTNHTYAAVGAYVPTKIMSGGDGLKYSASTIIFLSKSKDKDGTEVIGNIIKCKLEKSRFTREQMTVETNLNFETGLDKYYGLTDLAVEAGIWKNLGGRIELPDGKKVFGKAINRNPSQYFTDDVLKIIDDYCAKKFKYGVVGAVLENNQEDDEDEFS
jgi:RecA/RadA recombinase